MGAGVDEVLAMAAVNYRGVGEYSCFCADLVQAEADDGIVSHGYVGIPLFSCRLHPRNVVAGAKPRMVADLGALRVEHLPVVY
jgi:hypothetical protein